MYGNAVTINSFDFTIRYTGSIQAYYGVSSSEDTAPSSWTEITGFSSGVEQTVTTSGGSDPWLFYKVVLGVGATLATTKDVYGRMTAPAVRIRNIA